MKLPHGRWFFHLCVASAIFTSGCAGEVSRPAHSLSVEAAKDALVLSLRAWKSGQRETGEFLSSKPSVGVVDTLRRLRPLIDYEVIGSLGSMENVRPFAVRLVLDAPSETITTRYLVVGQDPIWVFRQEDYELILHWEHKMPAEADRATPAAPDGGNRGALIDGHSR